MHTEALAEPALAEPTPVDIVLPPTQDELPCDDGAPMETERHRLQMELLIHGLKPWLNRQGAGYVGGNMFIYFSLEQVRNQNFRGPDAFVVLEVPARERKSWVVWEENKAPDVVIELLFESTAERDKGVKKLIYQDQLRVPEYFWFDPFNPDDRAGFALRDGVYEALAPDDQDRLISHRLNLSLICWQGVYGGVETIWLRWATVAGELLLTEAEAAERRAQQAEQRAERLAAKLRALDIDPDKL